MVTVAVCFGIGMSGRSSNSTRRSSTWAQHRAPVLHGVQHNMPRRSDHVQDATIDAAVPSTVAYGELRVYTEALVHPGIFAAAEPATVLVLATPGSLVVCELRKHRKVVSIELVSLIAGDHHVSDFPCANTTTGVGSTIHSLEWVKGRVGAAAGSCAPGTALFDAVVIDPLPQAKPSVAVEDVVLHSLRCLVLPTGTVTLHLGAAPSPVAEAIGAAPHPDHLRALAMINRLHVLATATENRGDNDFDAPGGVQVYQAFIGSTGPPAAFAVACLSTACSLRFARTASGVELAVARRLKPEALGTLIWYDGPTHAGLKPSRAWEYLGCAADPRTCGDRPRGPVIDATPAGPGVDDYLDDPEAAVIEWRDSGDDRAPSETIPDKTVYTKIGMEASSYLLYDTSTQLEFSVQQLHALERLVKLTANPHLVHLEEWVDRYGYGCRGATGDYAVQVSTGSLMTFANHACTPNASIKAAPNISRGNGQWPVYAARDRARSCMFKMGRKVSAGEQVREDYSKFTPFDSEDKAEDNAEYATWCGGGVKTN
jgi:hypothetical protein